LAPVALAALAAVQAACASGSLETQSASDGGDEAGDGQAVGEGGSHEGSTSDGGGGSLTTACSDNATQYCNQLNTCSPFLLQVQYGDVPTCQTQLGSAYCMDIVTAKGTGWTAAGLEGCIQARAKLTCQDFLYLKPAPKACTPTGTLSNTACRYDAQCGTGYCRITAGSTSMCGNCVPRQTTGGACMTSNDCDGNLVCSTMGACAAPQPLDAQCGPTMTPCQSGLVCINGKCAQAGGTDAGCDPTSGLGCDYNLGAYCEIEAGACASITVSMSASACGGSPPAVCFGDGNCSAGFCVPPLQDGTACDGGDNCTTPSTCNSGTCGLFPASSCH
jgi:hypothetical protein